MDPRGLKPARYPMITCLYTDTEDKEGSWNHSRGQHDSSSRRFAVIQALQKRLLSKWHIADTALPRIVTAHWPNPLHRIDAIDRGCGCSLTIWYLFLSLALRLHS